MNLFFAPSRRLAARRRAEGGPRIYDPRERAVVSLLDQALRLGSWIGGLRPEKELPEPRHAARVLALRLDRLGDLVTTLPALEALRAALPEASIELAVGSWNEPIGRRLPFIDRLRVVDVPWAAWGQNVRFSEARKALGEERFDLALDFQGDVRVLFLMALVGARLRAGYGDTGGRYLLTHEAKWDESRSWYRQNMELVRSLFPTVGGDGPIHPYNFVTEDDRKEAALLLRANGIDEGRDRPLVGVQPSAGRSLKQWEPEKFAALIDDLSGSATVVITGSTGDRSLVDSIVAKAKSRPRILLGSPLSTFAAVIERFDLFITGDTGPMHVAQAVGTNNLALFGPSDPVRYGPEESFGRRVVREELYCSPCNMIRRPPRECARARVPECIAKITVGRVSETARSMIGS